MEAPGVDRFEASLVLAGAGKMGGAMLRAWLGRGYDPRKISVIEPRPSPEIIGARARHTRLRDGGRLRGRPKFSCSR